jgi:hypothetical protein
MFGAKTCRFRLAVLLCAWLCGGVVGAQVAHKARSYYRYHIGAGDVLQISVQQHPELSGTVVVRSSGDINLPWHKTVKVAGLSVAATSELLRLELESVVGWSCVTLTIKQRNGSWVLEKEPYFIDVPSPSQSDAARMRDS